MNDESCSPFLGNRKKRFFFQSGTFFNLINAIQTDLQFKLCLADAPLEDAVPQFQNTS